MLMVVSRFSMFVNIQTFFFNSGRNTQAVNFVEDFEDDVSHQCGPSADDDYTKNLCTEESEATSVECAAFYGKQTGKNGSELPHTPCTEEAPTGSSIFRRCSMNSTAKIMTVPQIAPIRALPLVIPGRIRLLHRRVRQGYH